MKNINHFILGILIILTIQGCRQLQNKDVESSLQQTYHTQIKTVKAIHASVKMIENHLEPEQFRIELVEHVQNYPFEFSEIRQETLVKIGTDSSFFEKCWYLYDLKSNWQSISSRHFIYYYMEPNQPDSVMMLKWDQYFELYEKQFKNTFSERLIFKIDPEEPWGRCFAPWEVTHSIRMQGLSDNPHELVHLFFFQYSDVPFFHEPVAYFYGSWKGDWQLVTRKLNDYLPLLQEKGYIKAVDLLHFPAIVGLDKQKWASAFLFSHQLIERYGLEQYMRLAEMNPWQAPVEKLSKTFFDLYGFSLTEYENQLVQFILEREG